MWVTMGLTRRVVRRVLVLVMLVVHVRVGVLHLLMDMLVLMPLGEM